MTLYGYGPRADDFSGHRENTEVAGFVSEILDLDLDAVSKKLRANHTWIDQWVKKKPGAKFEKRSLALHHH